MAIALKKETANKLLQLLKDKREDIPPENTFPRPNNIQFVFVMGEVVPSSLSSSESSEASSESSSSESSSSDSPMYECDGVTELPDSLTASLTWASFAPSFFGVSCPSSVTLSLGNNDCNGLYEGCDSLEQWGTTITLGSYNVCFTLTLCCFADSTNWTFFTTGLFSTLGGGTLAEQTGGYDIASGGTWFTTANSPFDETAPWSIPSTIADGYIDAVSIS